MEKNIWKKYLEIFARRIGFCVFYVNAGIYYTNTTYASIYVENAESDWILPAESDSAQYWIPPAQFDIIGFMFVAQVGLMSV